MSVIFGTGCERGRLFASRSKFKRGNFFNPEHVKDPTSLAAGRRRLLFWAGRRFGNHADSSPSSSENALLLYEQVITSYVKGNNQKLCKLFFKSIIVKFVYCNCLTIFIFREEDLCFGGS